MNREKIIELNERTRLLCILVHDDQVAKSPPGRPPRYFSHFESTSFGTSVEFRPWKNTDDLVAKLISRTRRLWRCRDEDFRRDRRVIGRGEVRSKLVRRDVCGGLGGGLLSLASSGSRD